MIRILALSRSRRVFCRALLLTVAFLIGQGCGSDVKPPSQDDKYTPPTEAKDAKAKTSRGPGGGMMKSKSAR
jgi:hypothetical protein